MFHFYTNYCNVFRKMTKYLHYTRSQSGTTPQIVTRALRVVTPFVLYVEIDL